MTKFSKDNQPATGASNKRRQTVKDAINLALNREIEVDEDGEKITRRRINVLADRMVISAIGGDNVAAKEVFDRTDGKAAQSLMLQGDEENPIVTKIVVEIID